MSICDLGVFGTRYIRDTPAPETLSLVLGDVKRVLIESIYAELPIGNTLDIKLRQKSGFELGFVTFEEVATGTNVIIDTIGLPIGTYTLELESYDDAGGVYTTLKTDKITMDVIESAVEVLQTEWL